MVRPTTMMPTSLLRIRLPPSEPITRSGPLNRFSRLHALTLSIRKGSSWRSLLGGRAAGRAKRNPASSRFPHWVQNREPSGLGMILPQPSDGLKVVRPALRHRTPVRAKRTLSLSEYRLQPLICTSLMNGSCEEPLLPVRHYGVQSKNREVGKTLRRPFGDHVTNTKRGG